MLELAAPSHRDADDLPALGADVGSDTERADIFLPDDDFGEAQEATLVEVVHPEVGDTSTMDDLDDVLTHLLAAEKRKGGEKMDEARVKRIREELEQGAPPKARGTLIVEFSIENVQVVQRRAAKTGKDGKAEKDRKGGKEQKAKK